MVELLEIKKQLWDKVDGILEEKISTLNQLIESAKESRDSDTKSSVGDKYETNRAMMHIEIAKNESQRNNFIRLKRELPKINLARPDTEVGFGSVVQTNIGNYFVSVAVGDLEIQTQCFYCISLASPLGKLLQGKKKGDKVLGNNKEVFIERLS